MRIKDEKNENFMMDWCSSEDSFLIYVVYCTKELSGIWKKTVVGTVVISPATGHKELNEGLYVTKIRVELDYYYLLAFYQKTSNCKMDPCKSWSCSFFESVFLNVEECGGKKNKWWEWEKILFEKFTTHSHIFPCAVLIIQL